MTDRDLALAIREQRRDDVIQNLVGVTPGAQTDPAPFVVPGGKVWRLLAAFNGLTTAAGAGTRSPRFVIDDGVNTLTQVGPPLGQIASLSIVYALLPNAPMVIPTASNLPALMPLPTFPLVAGWRVRFNVPVYVGGDQWGAPRIIVEEFDEGPLGLYAGVDRDVELAAMLWDAGRGA